MAEQRRFSWLLWFALAGLAACSRPAAPRADGVPPPAGLRHVRLQTDWFPQGEHGGFYQALAKGFYREAGLDVELLPGGPGANIKPKVISGDAEFGMNPSTDVIVAANRGLPLLIVGAVLQHDPEALLLHADNPINSFKQLDGQTITAVPTLVWIQLLQKKYGIHFNLQPMPYGLAGFFANPAAIQECLVTNEPYIAQQQGVRVKTLPIADSGYDAYHVIFCRRDFAQANPGLTRAFVAASVRGWRDYVEGDPAPAHRLILARNAQMTSEFLAFSRSELVLRRLVTGDPAKGEGIGRLSLSRLGEAIDLLLELKVIDAPMAVRAVATKDYLPPESLR
jgi:NitT/TauT family transport system substrate-binding protein